MSPVSAESPSGCGQPEQHRCSSAAPSSAPATATEARNWGAQLPPSFPPSQPASRSPGAAPVSTLQTELLERTNTFREPPAAQLPVSRPTKATPRCRRSRRRIHPTGPRSPPPRSCPWWPLGPPAGAQRRAPAAHHVPLSSGPARLGSPHRAASAAAPLHRAPAPAAARSLCPPAPSAPLGRDRPAAHSRRGEPAAGLTPSRRRRRRTRKAPAAARSCPGPPPSRPGGAGAEAEPGPRRSLRRAQPRPAPPRPGRSAGSAPGSELRPARPVLSCPVPLLPPVLGTRARLLGARKPALECGVKGARGLEGARRLAPVWGRLHSRARHRTAVQSSAVRREVLPEVVKKYVPAGFCYGQAALR